MVGEQLFYNLNIHDSSCIKSRFLNICIYLYFALSIYEYVFVGDSGSYLKLFGFFIMIIWFIKMIQFKKNIVIRKHTKYLILWEIINIFSLLWTKGFDTGLYWTLAIGNMICILIVVQNLYWTNTNLEKMIFWYRISALIFCLLIILNKNLYHGSGIRYTVSIAGYEMDPNGIVGFLFPTVVFAIDAILKKKSSSLFNFTTLGLSIYSSLMAASRGGIMGISIAVFVYLIYFLLKERKTKKINRMVILTSVGFVVIFIVLNNLNEELINRVFGSNYMEDRGSDRLDIWFIGWEYFKQHPIFGLGIGGFGAEIGRGMHNMYLSTLIDTGIIGFVFFIGTFICYLMKLSKNNQYLGISLIVGIMIIIFFLDTHQKKIMWNILVLSTIMIETNIEKLKNKLY